MNSFVKRLLMLAAKTPDGFTSLLPDGSILEVNWLYGIKEVRSPKGTRKIGEVFGVVLGMGDDEVVVILHEQKADDNGSES